MPTDDPAMAPAVTSPRWMRVLLVVSLALNLLVAGALVGLAIRGGPAGGASREVGFGPFAAALTPEDRDALRREFVAGIRAEAGPRTRREDMRALMQALRADPFDASALHEVMARVGTRMSGRIETGFALIEGRIAAMTGAERQAFADRLEGELRRFGRRRGGGDQAAP